MKNKGNMKYKSTKQFFWHFKQLEKACVIKPMLQPDSEWIKEQNRIQLLVNKRVRWELGPEGWSEWMSNGHKDYPTLARAYGIK